jgi:5,6-dimethylbenzimidazole synthase
MSNTSEDPSYLAHAFSPESKAAVYEAIYRRRDIRHFRSEPIPEETLAAILYQSAIRGTNLGQVIWPHHPSLRNCLSERRLVLQAAHHAPSVGFMQPWNFVLIQEESTKQQVAVLFERENALTATVYDNERQQLYRSLK